VGLAEVMYERNDLDAAGRHALAGVTGCRQLAYAPALATGLAILARIRHAEGDRTGARDAIAQAEAVMPGPEVADLLNPVPSTSARLMLDHGDVAGAEAWVRRLGLHYDDQPDYPHERGYLLLARVLLATPDHDRALALLDRLSALAVAEDRAGSLVEVETLRARALSAASDDGGAVAALAKAVRLAAPAGYVRVFLDEGPSMSRLVRRLATTPVEAQGPAATGRAHEHLRRLLRAFSVEYPALPAQSGALLSAREAEVLELLAGGASNQQIARRLVITLDTVKRHVTHILEKLGAGNRTEAAARARELGLLP
jgi:LuxR family maltose regulon positive regulatory protein